ncbi:MAG: cobalt transporter [Thaumarchaeota archaeon 13_1_40CM_38_12]|nr:MAG: cobalt transporter [Thaumarchaeota archaeon 13_1_40CM_38_12]OLC36343.1 MAG: cobalt transporter [Thaumarchaeota archaeon 13_1_40CM_4_38_7]OLC92978.1 MAG: cobalt transporter [Thaumarchaeota archaeon 13_1_40CM_3_38_6]OLD41653.1 MAG: cobalt transporter [Thaumarchaeota archaeon 13_1_40CM_2_39_4]TLY04441.1 MAG: CbtB-domain containing protein [Nitrososphaerota archaeon]
MVNTFQITKAQGKIPKIAVAVLLVIFGIGFFAVGFDQGQIFSLVQGQQASGQMYLHEMTHDMRHASGFPCH